MQNPLQFLKQNTLEPLEKIMAYLSAMQNKIAKKKTV